MACGPMKIRAFKFLWIFLLPVAILTSWQLISSYSPNPFFPSPARIFDAAQDVISIEWILISMKSSLLVLLSGYAFGSFLGLIFGSLLGEFKVARDVLLPICNFIRCIPSVAKVPLVMAIMGLGLSTRITIVTVAVLFPVLMSTVRAVGATKLELLELSRSLKFGRMRGLLSIRIHGAIGEILTGLHASVQVAVLTMIVSEMLGSGIGIGAFIIQSQSTFRIANMWVGVFIVGLIGLALNYLFLRIEQRVAPWYFKSKGLI